jgi:hypothetical protein
MDKDSNFHLKVFLKNSCLFVKIVFFLIIAATNCIICDRLGRHFCAYGAVNACKACGTFFTYWRSEEKREQSKSFKCKQQQNCRVHWSIPKNCAFCRFQKCLNSGMVYKSK